jgi:negative regulator of flagellin synthesis FlgM
VRIGNPLDLYRSGAAAGGAASADADKAKTGSATPSPTKTESSATVKLSDGLQALSASLNAEKPFDAKRVEELKAAIAEGSFRVNAEVVADKVIASNLDALTRAKR